MKLTIHGLLFASKVLKRDFFELPTFNFSGEVSCHPVKSLVNSGLIRPSLDWSNLHSCLDFGTCKEKISFTDICEHYKWISSRTEPTLICNPLANTLAASGCCQ